MVVPLSVSYLWSQCGRHYGSLGLPLGLMRPPGRRGLQAESPEHSCCPGTPLQLVTGEVTIPPITVPRELHFLSPEFVASWNHGMLIDPFFALDFKGSAATVGVSVYSLSVASSTERSAGGTFFIRWALLLRRGQCEADRTACTSPKEATLTVASTGS